MNILTVVGAATADEDAAVRELVAAIKAGSYSSDLLDRLPGGRVEVIVASDANDQLRAVIVIENGVFHMQPLVTQ